MLPEMPIVLEPSAVCATETDLSVKYNHPPASIYVGYEIFPEYEPFDPLIVIVIDQFPPRYDFDLDLPMYALAVTVDVLFVSLPPLSDHTILYVHSELAVDPVIVPLAILFHRP